MYYIGHIQGLELQWVSATQIRVRPGGAGPEAYADPLADNSASLHGLLTLTPVLSASAWHFVYVSASATGAQFEVSTTAPAATFAGGGGTARSMAGDATRRFIGSFLTDASSNIYNFRRYGQGAVQEVRYQEATGSAPFRVLNAGSATTLTNVNCSSVVPPTSTRAICRVIAGGATFLSHPVTSAELSVIAAGQERLEPIELNPTQRFSYRTTAGGSTTVDVYGYIEER